MLLCAARANHGEPGLITAYDAHGSQIPIDDAFLGNYKPGALRRYPFFDEFKPTMFPADGDFEAFAYRQGKPWRGKLKGAILCEACTSPNGTSTRFGRGMSRLD